MRQLRKCYQEQNHHSKLNGHGGNNIILTEAQEQAVFQFCQDQFVVGLGASARSIIYAAICYFHQQEKCNPPSRSWFQK